MLNYLKQTSFATILVGATGVSGRRHLDDKLNTFYRPIGDDIKTYEGAVKEYHSPLVKGTDCTTMCLFNDGLNSFCWKFQSPMLTAGWDWSQSTDDYEW